MPPASSRTPSLTLKRLLSTFAIIAAILWLLPLLSTHSVLYPPGPNFADILVYKGRFTVYHTARFFTSRAFSGFAYPAGAAPIYEALYRTSNPTATYLLLAAIASTTALAAAWFTLKRHNAASLFLSLLLTVSFPLVFLIQRANIEILLWITLAVAILLYRRNLAIPAAVLIGVAAAVKLYPIFLLGLFLKRRRDLPAFAIGLATALIAMGAAIAYAGPTFSVAAHGFFNGVDRFQDHYVDTVSRIELVFDHCLFSPVKYWAFSTHTPLAPYTKPYYIAAGAFALLLFLRVRTLPFLNRATFLCAAMVSLPPVSFTYTLVHLYVPLVLLLAMLSTSRTRPPLTATAALALLLFLGLPLMSLNAIHPVSTGSIQSLALFALLIVTAISAWPSNAPADAL